MSIKKVTITAIIAATYVVLCLVMGTLSYGPIQIRVAEVLMILCIFDDRFIFPLTLGCFMANLIGLMMGLNYLTLDIIFGTLATLVSGILMFKLRHIKYKNREILSMVIPPIINGIIIGIELVLYTSYAGNISLFMTYFIYIFIGELLSTLILGLCLYRPLKSIATYVSSKEQ